MSRSRITPIVKNSNLPPRTVPYAEYQYPNWYERLKGDFQQTDDGFGFSNFRQSNQTPNTLNESLPPFYQTTTEQMPLNPEATQELMRSETRLFRDKYGDYPLYHEDDNDGYQYDNVVNTTIGTNPTMQLFFSHRNVDHVLRLICRLIRQFCPEYKITPESQNKAELLTIFRSMYFQVPTNPYGTPEEQEKQLCRLNRAVLDWTVPRMLVNIQSYLGYVRDQSTRRQTIERPQNVNVAGTRTNILRPVC